MKRHATEDTDDPTATLCGRPSEAAAIDNAAPTCRTCRKVIQSRCFAHNVSRCRVCPVEQRIGWPPPDVA
jgi:hypothetical protein